MSQHSDRIMPVLVYTLPMLEKDVTGLESFLAVKEVPLGLPLFDLSIEVDYCISLVASVSVVGEGAPGFEKMHSQVVGSLNLLRNRLSLIYKTFLHGRKCCLNEIENQTGDGLLHVFPVRDEYTTLESYCSQSYNPNGLPLLAVCSSLDGCLSYLEITLSCAEDDYFAGRGPKGVGDCLDMINHQLDLINDLIDAAQDCSIIIKKVA